MRLTMILSMLMYATPGIALAADFPARICTGTPSLPEPWLTWASPSRAIAGHDATTAAPVPIGRAVEATLSPLAHVQYPLAPTKPLAANSYGGTFRVDVAYASRIGIALSSAAWVDMVEQNKVVDSAAHGHGPDCTAIHKIVWFDLKPGAHIVQIANAPTATIRIMAAELSGQR